MTAATHNEPAGTSSDEAVACAACGYDLRGFGPRDRCPECGTAVAISLAARVAPAAALDPAWRRQVHEAAALALVSFALLLGSTALPFVAAGGSPVSRLELLNTLTLLSASGWALQWWSTMKLCRTPRVECRKWPANGLTWATVGLSTFYTLLPLLVMHFEHVRNSVPQWAVDAPIALAGPLCAVTYYLWLGAVFRRFGAPGAAAQAVLLAALMPLCLPSLRSSMGFAWGHAMYAMLPTYQQGSPSAGGWFVRALLDEGAPVSPGLFALAEGVSLCGTYLHVRLLLMSRKERGDRANRSTVATDSAAPESAAGTVPSAHARWYDDR